MRDNWLCPLRLRIIRIVVLETLKIRIWKALISVIFFIALINVLRQQLHLGPTSNELVQLKADFSEEEGKKKSFDVPGWSFGTSLSAVDYVDYFRAQTLILPENRGQDISHFHAGNITTCREVFFELSSLLFAHRQSYRSTSWCDECL